MKIAFCFLTYDSIIRYDIWNKFFHTIDQSKYVVYIHPKIIKNNEINNKSSYTFPYTYVKNRIYTKAKYDISIVQATLRLLEECYLSDSNITHFIFLSQSCIPLYSFNKLYNVITLFPHSVISCIYRNKINRYNNLDYEIKKKLSILYFVKQQPNMILIREDVEDLIKYNYTPFFKNMECPDEHYFINILLYILKKKIIKKATHFCNHDLNKTQALEFKNVDHLFINKIRNLGFLFMRKLSYNSIIDIDVLFIDFDQQK
jgi:hypothetical protein